MGISLFDQRSIGRGFQLAALGAVYSQVSESVRNAINDSLSSGELSLNENELQELGERLADFLTQVCGQRTSYFPTLYTAGKGDAKILGELGIINPASKAYCNDLINYSKDVKNKDLSKTSSIPMFVRAYIFSEYRDSLAKRSKSAKEEAEAGSLWLAFAGAYIALVAGVRTADTNYDIYVIPDGSLPSIISASNFYGLIYSEKVKVKLWQIMRSIYDNKLGISPEISLWLSTLIHVVQDEALAVKLSGDKGYESFVITRVLSDGNRPQVVWSSVLSLSRYVESLEKHKALYIMNYLGYVISDLKRLKDEDRNKVEPALVTCSHELFRYLEAKDLSSLQMCASALSRAYPDIKDVKYSENFRRLVEGIARLT